MKKMHLIRIVIVNASLLLPLQAINAQFALSSPNKARGFSSVVACRERDGQLTRFILSIDTAVFLSFFTTENSQAAQYHAKLVSRNTGDFVGVSVDLGVISADRATARFQFEVPTADLEHYFLEFQCGIVVPNQPILGGECWTSSLKSLRESPEAITELDPIWLELQKAAGETE